MYNFDIFPLIFCLGAVAGGALGLVAAAVAWAFAPLGWWTFAAVVMSALVGGVVSVKTVK